MLDYYKASEGNWKDLLDYYNHHSVPILCTFDDTQNPMRTLYFPVAMSEKVAFYALLALSATHRAQVLSSLQDKQRALRFETKTLEVLQNHHRLSATSQQASPNELMLSHPSPPLEILTAITILMGARYLDRHGSNGVSYDYGQHVRGFWAVLRHSDIQLDELHLVPSQSHLYDVLRIACYFTMCALVEGIDLGMDLPWGACERILAGTSDGVDYHAGYCHRYLTTLAEIVSLERSQTAPEPATETRKRATTLARKLARTSEPPSANENWHLSDDGTFQGQRHDHEFHRSVERAFRLSLAVRIHVGILHTSVSSPTIRSLVQSALSEYQQKQPPELADAFSLYALYEIGKACADPILQAFILERLLKISWRGYGTPDVYRTQLQQLWSKPQLDANATQP